MQHLLKETLPVASSLDRFVNIKVEYTEWVDFLDIARFIANEKLSIADLDQPNARVSLNFDVHSVISCEKS